MTELPEAERKVREFLVRHGDDNMEVVMAEYDRLRAELEQRAGCEHLDGPYRKLLAERDQLREELDEDVGVMNMLRRHRDTAEGHLDVAAEILRDLVAGADDSRAWHIPGDIGPRARDLLARLDGNGDSCG